MNLVHSTTYSNGRFRPKADIQRMSAAGGQGMSNLSNGLTVLRTSCSTWV